MTFWEIMLIILLAPFVLIAGFYLIPIALMTLVVIIALPFLLIYLGVIGIIYLWENR